MTDHCTICGWPLTPSVNPPRHAYGLRACKALPFGTPEFREGVYASRTSAPDEANEAQP